MRPTNNKLYFITDGPRHLLASSSPVLSDAFLALSKKSDRTIKDVRFFHIISLNRCIDYIDNHLFFSCYSNTIQPSDPTPPTNRFFCAQLNNEEITTFFALLAARPSSTTYCDRQAARSVSAETFPNPPLPSLYIKHAVIRVVFCLLKKKLLRATSSCYVSLVM